MQENNVFPVPTQEKITRWLMYFGVGAGLVAGTLIVGPYVLAALKLAFDTGMAMLALGGISAALAVGSVVIYNFAPLVKKGIEILAYKTWEKMINAYPIVHMRLWHALVLDGIEDTKKAKKELAGIVGEHKSELIEIDDRIAEIRTALNDQRTSLETRRACETEIAEKLELRKPYARVVDSLSPAIDAFDRFIMLQEKYGKKLDNEINVADGNWRAEQSIQQGLKVWQRVTGKNIAKLNSEAAKKRVEMQLGNTFGQLEDVRRQMGIMVQAAAQNDEIAMANARKYIDDQLRTIDVPFVEIKEVQPSKVGRLLNLS